MSPNQTSTQWPTQLLPPQSPLPRNANFSLSHWYHNKPRKKLTTVPISRENPEILTLIRFLKPLVSASCLLGSFRNLQVQGSLKGWSQDQPFFLRKLKGQDSLSKRQ